MEQQTDSSHQDEAVCVIQGDAIVQKQLDALLAHLDSPVLSFKSPEQFIHRCSGINIGCILIHADQMGDNSQHLLFRLSRMGLSGATIIMAQQASIDNTVKALQSGMADDLEIPQPHRLLIAKIRQVMGDYRSVPLGERS